MVEYLEQEFGDRALNGDLAQLEILQLQVKDLEAKLEAQKAGDNAGDDKSEKAANSEDETDSDVSFSL